MEHQVYRDQAQGVILDAYGKMVVEECKKFDEKTKQKIHDYIQQQVPLNLVEQLKQDGKIRLEHYQKFYQNGTYERSRESGTEANYDMVDGLVNNQKKNQEKTSDAAMTEFDAVTGTPASWRQVTHADSTCSSGSNRRGRLSQRRRCMTMMLASSSLMPSDE